MKSLIKQKKTLNDELIKKCRESCLWNTFETWQFKTLKFTDLRDYPGQWGLEKDTESIENKEAKFVLSILRNALAHGNSWTMNDPIDTLVFVSLKEWNKECKGPFYAIQCSPKALTQFLKNWVNFLNQLQIPSEQCVDTGTFR
jgi:hypothetical protein